MYERQASEIKRTWMRKTDRRVTCRPPLRWCTSVTSDIAAESRLSPHTRLAAVLPISA